MSAALQLDGQNHTISGLYFNDSKTSVGLFGKIDNATICNLGVIDSFFQAKVEVAAVCGYSHYGTETSMKILYRRIPM